MNRTELSELIVHHQRSDQQLPEINCRAAGVAPKTLDTDARTVRCTLTTEDPVIVYDYRSGRLVLETLLVDGAEYDDQTPLLRDHRQYSVDSILGSVFEPTVARDKLDGLLEFGEELDQAAESIWKRVKQGHLRRVSVGYTYSAEDFITIEPGETAVVKGRTFKAPKTRALRVVHRWRLVEVSVVVIPADKRAQMRGGTPGAPGKESEGITHRTDVDGIISPATPPSIKTQVTMNPLIDFLRTAGMPETIEANAAAMKWAEDHLGRSHWGKFTEMCRSNLIAFDPLLFGGKSETTDPAPPEPSGGQRSTPTEVVTEVVDPVDGAKAERERQSAIRNLATLNSTIPVELVRKACDEGWSLEKAQSEFADKVRKEAPEPVAPVAHIRGSVGMRELQAGLLLKNGITPDTAALRGETAASVLHRRGFDSAWLAGARREGDDRNDVEAAFDGARRRGLDSADMFDFAKEMLALRGIQTGYDKQDILERAFASSDFSVLFGSTIHMKMVEGYDQTAKTFEQFCRVVDVPDFRENNEATAGHIGGFKKQGKNGGKAANLNVVPPTYAKFAAERYAGQLKITDQMFFADSFGILAQTPSDIGASAADIPNDIALSILLGNGNLSDGLALLLAGQSLIIGGTLDEAGVSAALTMLKAKKVNGKRIQVKEALLMTGIGLSTKAKKVLRSSTTSGDDNVLKGVATHLEESALDLGVDDPRTDPVTPIAARPSSYYMFAKPAKSIVIAFRQGTNRGPVSRQSVLTDGEWGVGYDCFVDCGGAGGSRVGVVEVRTD